MLKSSGYGDWVVQIEILLHIRPIKDYLEALTIFTHSLYFRFKNRLIDIIMDYIIIQARLRSWNTKIIIFKLRVFVTKVLYILRS